MPFIRLRSALFKTATTVAVASCLTSVHAAESILIVDFEGADYGAWKATGTAFGDGPAQGTLPEQRLAEGFQGKGLMNSFRGGDGATGPS